MINQQRQFHSKSITDPQASDPSQSEDVVLWTEFKLGSKLAATRIYELHIDALFNYGCNLTPDRNLVKDTIQDLFCDLMKAGDKLADTTSIKFYLLKALRYKLLRSKKKLARISLKEDALKMDGFETVVSHEQHLIGLQMDKEKKELIQSLMNKLPLLQREGIALYFFEGLKYEQIAEVLGIKIKSARALIYRALTSLDEKIDSPK